MSRFPDKRIFVAVAFVAAGILLLIWIVFFWQIRNVKKISEDYQKEKLNSFIQEEKGKKLAALKKEMVNLEEQNIKFNALFIEKDDVLQFLEKLEQTADQTSCVVRVTPVDIAKIKFEKKKAEKTAADDDLENTKAKKAEETAPVKEEPKDDLAGLRNFPSFTVEAKGTFQEVSNFLNKMENLPYFIRVLTLDMTAEGAQKNSVPADGALQSLNKEQGNASAEQKTTEIKNVKLTFTAVVYGK